MISKIDIKEVMCRFFYFMNVKLYYCINEKWFQKRLKDLNGSFYDIFRFFGFRKLPVSSYLNILLSNYSQLFVQLFGTLSIVRSYSF